MLQWLALRVKSRLEKTVASIVRSKGYEAFLPVYRKQQRWSDRRKWADLPLFPGYVFCRLDPSQRLTLLTIPGAMHFAGIGRTPVAIDDEEIEAVRTVASSAFMVEPWTYADRGPKVLLQRGPLAGLEGILIRQGGCQRLAISVSLLRRSVALEIEESWLERAADGTEAVASADSTA